MGADMIRGGESAARVEAVFDAAGTPQALSAMEEAGLRDGDDTTVILTREIASGRSTYRINRRTATQGMLQSIGRHLVDIHGQHEHQTLIHEENHLRFLDAFGGPEHAAVLAEYRDAFDGYKQAQTALSELQMDDRGRAQRADMLRFQVGEIDAAELAPDEEETLGSERSRLQHAERLLETVARVCELLGGDSEELAALAAVQVAEQELRSLAGIDAELDSLRMSWKEWPVLQEAPRTPGQLPDDGGRPGATGTDRGPAGGSRARKRKYGDSILELPAFRDRCAAELHELENVETREEQLRTELQARRKAAGKVGVELSAARRKLAGQLEKAVVEELAGLGMEAATFAVELERHEDPDGVLAPDGACLQATRRGVDLCRFLVSANAGEPLRPLSKVASGGELSRLMLVFKSVCARGAATPTIIFDEVDTGIGGRVAHAVGEKLVKVSAGAQVLCVTHLPQIARLADEHVHIEKQVRNGRTTVSAAP